MSIILDALKKSESDRQGKSRPESAPVPTGAEETSSSRWLSIVGILLLINVVVLLVVFLKPDSAVVAPEPDTVTEEADVAQPDSFRDLVANARDRQDTLSNSSASNPATNSAPPQAKPAAVESPAVQQTTPPPSTSSIVYKSFNEMRANGSVQLPDLRLDLHVFNSTPGERFVFINMNKYGENATLEEGPLVVEIVTEGVILEYTGKRFLLPRE
jgi:hypothetical protein